MERVHKFLARAGVASRRKCERLIADGRVTVNGKTMTELGVQIDPTRDVVAVDGVIVHPPSEHLYMAINKPAGFVTTVRDTHGRPTVLDLVSGLGRRVYPVGRLDMESEGLLLLTDDGELAYGISHPSRGVAKVYRVRLARPITKSELATISSGIELEDGLTMPAPAKFIGRSDRLVEIELREGRKRQIRRMFATIGNEVVQLTRIAIGCVSLGTLREGASRRLTAEEVRGLKRLARVDNCDDID
ncbi:MAG: pseudouridine synthase [Firmicutes bacterium]|jgi:pseudouridine synthase|nr:pseudouridine synthase [Bacillota bacterium]MDD4793421.1 pseudouridine synthase [Bacillota bacterium]